MALCKLYDRDYIIFSAFCYKLRYTNKCCDVAKEDD